MEIILILVLLAAGYIFWIKSIVTKGNAYHSLVHQYVISELGIAAVPLLENRVIIEQITEMYRQGKSASSTAMHITMLLQSDLFVGLLESDSDATGS